MSDIKKYDFGFIGDADGETAFLCFIKVPGALSVVVVDENAQEITIPLPRFRKIGNLADGSVKVLPSFLKNPDTAQEAFDFIDISLDEIYAAALSVIHEDIGKREATVVSIPSKELMDNVYLRLVKNDVLDHASEGKFIKGVCYPVFHGCLLDEDDACFYDNIHSVEELNRWEKGRRIWEVWDIRKPSCFKADDEK